MNRETKVAFALGGLAGNNAHGAGFLQAALGFADLRPTTISCTSGQIRWVARYLHRLSDPEKARDLEDILRDEITGMEPLRYRWRDLDFAQLWWFGVRGVYEPAWRDYATDWWQNANQSVMNMARDQTEGKPFITRRIWEVWPCHLLNPASSEDLIREITVLLTTVADSLQIGIVFNSYDPKKGSEKVYLNHTARAQLRKHSGNTHHYERGHASTYRRHGNEGTFYDSIGPSAVRAALHLYAYGFDHQGGPNGGQVDGAYFRDVILSELSHADHIFAVRPMHSHWQARLPTSEVEMEDLKTQVMFKSAYVGEKSQIELINKLLLSARITDPRYHPVHLHEIEMEKRRGFFDYCFEDIEVFRDSFNRSRKRLAEVLHLRPLPAGVT